VFIALVIQHTMHMRRVVTCGLSRPIIFSALPHKRHEFRRKVIEHKKCVLIFSTNFFFKYVILRRTENDNLRIYKRLHVKYPLLYHTLTKLKLSLQIFEKYSNKKFRENTSSGSRVVHCQPTDGQTYRQT